MYWHHGVLPLSSKHDNDAVLLSGIKISPAPDRLSFPVAAGERLAILILGAHGLYNK